MIKRDIRYSARFTLSYILGLCVALPLGLLVGVALDEIGIGARNAMTCAFLCAGLQLMWWGGRAALNPKNGTKNRALHSAPDMLDQKIYYTSFIVITIGLTMSVLCVVNLIK